MEKNIDPKALYSIGYGLYVVTCSDGNKDNGLILNSVMQAAGSPERIAVCINKQNYSHDVIKKSGILNVCCLTTEAPFAVFEAFGFKSGRDTDKFASCTPPRSENGLVYLPKYINSVISLEVVSYVDLGSHGMFICGITGSKVISDAESMTYAYYHKNVKPKPKAPDNAEKDKPRGWVCKICGYVYEGEELPADFVCPLCKHGADDFEAL